MTVSEIVTPDSDVVVYPPLFKIGDLVKAKKHVSAWGGNAPITTNAGVHHPAKVAGLVGIVTKVTSRSSSASVIIGTNLYEVMFFALGSGRYRVFENELTFVQ
jgi:hypothetical protein